MYVIARRPAADVAPTGDSLRSQSILFKMSEILGNTAQLCLRTSADLFRQFRSLKSSKYIQYSFTFQTLT